MRALLLRTFVTKLLFIFASEEVARTCGASGLTYAPGPAGGEGEHAKRRTGVFVRAVVHCAILNRGEGHDAGGRVSGAGGVEIYFSRGGSTPSRPRS